MISRIRRDHGTMVNLPPAKSMPSAHLPGTLWALHPEHLEGALALLAAPESEIRALAANTPPPAPVRRERSAAVLRVVGPILRHDNILSDLLGWPTVASLARQLTQANEDPGVERLILEIDSPGGTAAGIGDLAAMIHASAKPVSAVVDHLAASAAYWLAAAATEIVISPAAMLGSIGVVATYRPEKDAPIKIISRQSPLKHATPDTDPGRAETQRLVDQLADLFVGDVARYRRTQTQTVTERFGRGGLLVGASAVTAGMADRLGTLSRVLSSPRPERKPMMTTATPTSSAVERYEAQLKVYEATGLDRPQAVLAAAREHPELVAAANRERHPPPPDTGAILRERAAALEAITARGIPAAQAPLVLAREQPELARRAEAARVSGGRRHG